MCDVFEKTIQQIVTSIKEAGYDPYAQLIGYLQTGDASYITRRGDARKLVHMLEAEKLRRYIREMMR